MKQYRQVDTGNAVVFVETDLDFNIPQSFIDVRDAVQQHLVDTLIIDPGQTITIRSNTPCDRPMNSPIIQV